MSDVDVLGQVVAQRGAVARRLEAIQQVVAISSGKGGVGKSALTANLAVARSQDGQRVGVLDADIHGPTAALMLGARGQRLTSTAEGVLPAVGVADVRLMSMDLFLRDDQTAIHWKHPGGLADDSFVWRGALEANVLQEFLSDTAWGELDLLLVDMPPGADRFDTLMRLVPDLDGVLMVTTAGAAAQLVVRRAIAAARAAGAHLLGVIENMSSGQDDGASQQLAASFDSELLGRIPFDPQLAHQTDRGRPTVLEPHASPGAAALLELASTLGRILQK